MPCQRPYFGLCSKRISHLHGAHPLYEKVLEFSANLVDHNEALSTDCDAEPPGRPSEGPSNPLEPARDRPSDLVGTVLLQELETFDDDVVLVGEAARQAPDPTRDEHAGLRVDKELR